MNIKDTIENYMIDMDLVFKEVDDGTWLIEDDIAHIDNIVVKLLEPIVLFRVKIMTVPQNNREEFYKKLLELNASELVHGAYAIEEDSVVIVDTLQSENLDINEFRATIESIEMALMDHYKQLSKYSE
ncbi:hypothetical protein [Dethiothermospora halolimnae]|uniref:hypothetical protein n=1 Tax=Dethiothermospora halolimnae TaxID=3114390 RepID=UPI003CCC0140